MEIKKFSFTNAMGSVQKEADVNQNKAREAVTEIMNRSGIKTRAKDVKFSEEQINKMVEYAKTSKSAPAKSKSASFKGEAQVLRGKMIDEYGEKNAGKVDDAMNQLKSDTRFNYSWANRFKDWEDGRKPTSKEMGDVMEYVRTVVYRSRGA